MNAIAYSSVLSEELLAIKSNQAASLFKASGPTGSNGSLVNIPISCPCNL